MFDRRYASYGQAGYNLFAGGALLQPGAAVPVERFVAPGAPRLFLVGMRYEWDGRLNRQSCTNSQRRSPP
ncbi:hypothetical protein ACTMU2_36875 [Cupriavidus basilensis]